MQIGEFAKICNTKITVLRHYDKEGLLEADYVDPFTGYRYYSNEQIPIFFRITALKKAGFSLLEIKQILSSVQSNEEVLALFEKKQTELYRMIAELDDARKIILGEKAEFEIRFMENNGILQAESKTFHANYVKDAFGLMEGLISAKRYQRISPYQVQSIPNSGYAYLTCDVLKLNMNAVNIHDPILFPFENDEKIIGKWEIIGEYAVKEDFYAGIPKGSSSISDALKEIYFLPEGKRYWCYAWTKGKLFCYFDGETTANTYTTEMYNNALYMFIEMKSYEYRYGGRPTVLVLRQLDHVIYQAEAIRKRDKVDLPFISDERVMGNWKIFDCCKTKERFDPNDRSGGAFSVSSVCFEKDGNAILQYYAIDKTKEMKHTCRWTKDILIRGELACAYEIRLCEGREYLFLEWKNGDYVYGGREPWYYVFVRRSDHDAK